MIKKSIVPIILTVILIASIIVIFKDYMIDDIKYKANYKHVNDTIISTNTIYIHDTLFIDSSTIIRLFLEQNQHLERMHVIDDSLNLLTN